MYASLSMAASQNRVLRNTFILLAISLLPTILGAHLGIEMGLPAIMAESPWISLAIFLTVIFVLLFGIMATSSTVMVFPIISAFTLLMGAMLSGVISAALKLSNGAELISLAGAGTVAIMAGCSAYAATTKRDFSGMGGFLFGTLLAVIALGLLNIALQIPLLQLGLAFVTLVLFSAFMVFDVQKIVNGGETNYVHAFVQVYLNMLNIFSSLLQILMASND